MDLGLYRVYEGYNGRGWAHNPTYNRDDPYKALSGYEKWGYKYS